MRTTLVALVAVGLAARIAAADSVVATDERPALRRIEGQLGMMIGGADVGDASGFSVGLTTGLGYRLGDVTLRAGFDYYRVGDGSDDGSARHGRAARIGAAARYSFANTIEDPQRDHGNVAVDFWGEAGVGYEHVMWLAGGVLDRPSGELAVGLDVDGYGERNGHGNRHFVGYFMDLRTVLGEAPDMDVPAVCGGPCSQATKPPRTDVSMFFELGMHWGH